MLHSPIERARRNQLAERRAVERHDVHIRSVMIDVTLHDEPITILNISNHGLLAKAAGKFLIGSAVSINVPDLGSLNATIRWCGKGLIGCEFRDLIDEGSFFSYLQGVKTDA